MNDYKTLYNELLKKLSKDQEKIINYLSFLTLILNRTSDYSDIENFIYKMLQEAKIIFNNKINFYFYDDKNKNFYRQDNAQKNYLNIKNSLNKKITLSKDAIAINDKDEIQSLLNNTASSNSLIIVPIYRSNQLEGIFILSQEKPLNLADIRMFDMVSKIVSIAADNINNKHFLRTTYINIYKTMIKVLSLSDRSTFNHSIRVKHYATEISKNLGINKKGLKIIRLGSMLHDIGKIAINDSIINKPGKLTKEEFKIIQQHPVIGYKMLNHIAYFKDILQIVLNHHEKLDGSGYPNGIRNIDKLTQIVAVSDIIDAISATRSYKENNNFSYIIDELKKLRGIKLNSEIIDSAIDFVNSNKFLLMKKHMFEKEKYFNYDVDTGDMQDIIDKLKNDNSNLKKSLNIYRQQLSHKIQELEKFMASRKHTSIPLEPAKSHINDAIFEIINKYLNIESAIFLEINNYDISISGSAGKYINVENLIRIFSNDLLKTKLISLQIFQDNSLITIPINSHKSVCLIGSFNDTEEKTIHSIQSEIESTLKRISSNFNNLYAF